MGETATTTSDAHDLPHAEHGRKARAKLTRYDRMTARRKHRLPLSERTCTCTACGAVSPRDKNSARVMLIRAGLVPG
ncbi:hypothetical protein GCM10023235_01100 [Kitasatospora terrestris]|uniref:Transposase n=1 Tax=Kitasatospora terrestris TaxID=258051 RepID=A0ABP9DAN5_9ACTN